MKKIKGIIALALVGATLCGALPFAGCSDGDNNSNNENNNATTFTEKVDKSETPYASSLDYLKKTDWTANYIWTEKSIPNSYVAFRKSFTLDTKPSTATAYISAESKYYMWVNGVLTVFDGPYKRGLTKYDGFYDEVDIAENLQAGENNITILVCYNGRSSNSQIDVGQAGLIFESDIGGTKIVTDTSWKVLRLKAYKNQTLLRDDWPNYDQAAFLGEWDVYYDARDSVGDYTSPSFDDSSWENATIVGAVGYEPFNDLYESIAPAFGFDKDYTDIPEAAAYLNSEFTADTTITIPLPENMQFSLYFELSAKTEGARITYYTDTYISQGIASFKDDYIAVEGEQSYESYAWRTGTALIIEVPAGVTFTRLAYRESYYDSEQVGEFTSDNDELNTLWQKAANTLKICMRDTYMDCPERERSPYIGDATNQISETFYALDENSYAMTKKTMLTIIGWVGIDGTIPLRSPSKTLNENPAQTLAYFTSVYDYLLYTGDTETVSLFYPIMIDYLNLWEMDTDGSIVYRDGSFVWVDWGDGADAAVIQECWYYYALSSAKKVADICGITENTDFLTERMTSIKNVFATKYRKEKGYSSGTSYDDRANALAVVCGLATEADYADITEILKTVEKASPYMEKYVLEALCLMGEYDYAETRMLKRYDAMIADDTCSTLWELWGKDEGTVNHGWTGGPLTIMSKYFAGISPLSAGYESYEICPQNMFSSLSVNTHTVKGDISFTLKKSDGKTVITINTITADGTLKIPTSFGSKVTISGGTYTEGAHTDEYFVYKLTGGTYTVTIE